MTLNKEKRVVPRKLYVFWTDQAEWYIVCEACYYTNKENQWSGSTKVHDWFLHRKGIYEYLAKCEKNPDFKCEFCKDNPEEKGKSQFVN